MYIQDPKLWLQRDRTFDIGDKLCIRFTLPEIKSEVFGNHTNLSGKIPLLLKNGDEKINNFFKLSEPEQNKVITYFVKYIKSVSEDLDDEEALKSAIFNLSIFSIYFAQLEPNTEEFNYIIKHGILLFQADDILDDPDFWQDLNTDSLFTTFKETISQAQSGNLELFSKIPLKFPPMEKAWKLIVDKLLEVESSDPGILVKSYYWYFQSLLELFNSQILVFSQDKKIDQFDENTKVLIHGINKGLGVLLETQVYEQGIVVDSCIRQTFPFIEMINCFHRINSELNDVRGLCRDLKKGQVSDNNILRKVANNPNTDLATEFFNVMTNFRKDYVKLQMLTNFLEKAYADDIGLQKYLVLVKTLLDGQAYGYFGFTYFDLRYGIGGEHFIDKDEEESVW